MTYYGPSDPSDQIRRARASGHEVRLADQIAASCPGHSTDGHMQQVLARLTNLEARHRDTRDEERVRHMPNRFTNTLASLEQLTATSSGTQLVFDETVRAVAHTLDVPLCKILELSNDRSELLVRSGVGWQPGVVGRARVPAGPESQPGYALHRHEPVTFDDLSRTSRFTAASLARRHGIVSSACLPIGQADGTFGVLCVHDVKERRFSRDEILFLRRVAERLAFFLAAQARAGDR
jgi:transcriptional regulator with GAF, ATPase, and Fis domain